MTVKKKAVKKKAVKKRAGRKSNHLTPKRILFCFEYLIDLNGTKAAIRAGYSPKTAAVIAVELLKVPEIQAIIKAGLKTKIERTKIDADWVLKQSVRVYERCMQDEPVRDKDGAETGEYKFDSSGANKALDNVGKNIGVNAFKGTDDVGNPIDQNWTVTVVDGRSKPVDP